jgi:hypothetical protein
MHRGVIKQPLLKKIIQDPRLSEEEFRKFL